ncbi:MAG: hypothetical protein MJY82_10205 [Fibrobacter sp.]|nr:hypothetical protein [Fibrobacter sp.]
MKKSFLSLLLMVPVIAGAIELNPEDKCYHIADYDQLKDFATAVNNGESTACGILDADIVANEIEFNPNSGEPTTEPSNVWTPLKNFNGTFDGNNKTISGLYYVENDQGATGFIATTSGSDAIIQNLGITKSYFKSQNDAGVFVGQIKGSLLIKNSFNQSNVLAGTRLGGFVGYIDQLNQQNKGSLVIDASYNAGTVGLGLEGQYKQHIGGFVGTAMNSSLIITNSFNAGSVIGNAYVGGFVGSSYDGSVLIKNSYNTGSITGSQNVGAFVGLNGWSGEAPVTLVNSFYLDNGVSAVNGGSFDGATSKSSEDFSDGAVYTLLHDYKEIDEESGEVIFDGSVWQNDNGTPTINPNGGSTPEQPEAFVGIEFTLNSGSSTAWLKEGQDLIYLPRDTIVNRVVIERGFTTGTFATLMLPFNVKMSENTLQVYKFMGIHKESDGTNSKWVAHYSFVEDGAMVANQPYLVNPQVDINKYDLDFSADEITLKANTDTIYEQTAGNWTVKGTYKYILWDDAEYVSPHIFGFAASNYESTVAGQFVRAAEGASIRPMRFFLDYKAPMNRPGLFKSASFALPETIDIVIDDENGENSMTIGKLNTVTGEVKTDRWFDMKGRKLNAKPTFNGIFQNNGRQVIVK